MLIENFGTDEAWGCAGQLVVAPSCIVVKVEITVGVGQVKPNAILRSKDRFEECYSEPGLNALMHRSARFHHCAQAERLRPLTLQFVLDVSVVVRKVPRE